jgi:hypothetical protein
VPPGREPIEWKLITILPVISRIEATDRLDWYACAGRSGHSTRSSSQDARQKSRPFIFWLFPNACETAQG